jgi:hypothetical protein
LNEAGTVVRELTHLNAAAATATSDYGADEHGWLPLEDLPASPSTSHTPAVEGHHVKPDHPTKPSRL